MSAHLFRWKGVVPSHPNGRLDWNSQSVDAWCGLRLPNSEVEFNRASNIRRVECVACLEAYIASQKKAAGRCASAIARASRQLGIVQQRTGVAK